MHLRNQKEEPTSIPLGERVCRDPLPWIMVSAMMSAGATGLAWYSSGEFAYLTPTSGWGRVYYCAAIAVALLGGICPAYVLWHDAIGSVKLRHPGRILLSAGGVLAASTFVIVAQAFRGLDFAKTVSVTIVLAYVANRIIQRARDKASKDIEKDIEAVHLSNARRERFLSIAVDELFEAVTDAHKRAPNTLSATKADDSISNQGAKEC